MVTCLHGLLSRVAALQELLCRDGMDGALILQSADLVYFCGTYQDARLYVPARGRAVLTVRRSMGRIDPSRVPADVVPLSKPAGIPDVLAARGLKMPAVLGMELDVLPVALFRRYEKIFTSRIVDCSPQIRTLRMVKSTAEINLMKESAAMMDGVYARIPDLLQEGMSEYELAAAVEAAARRAGHTGLIRVRGFNQEFFYGCLLAGPSGGVSSYFDSPLGGPGLTPAFPFGVGRHVIAAGDPVMVDYVGVVNGYQVDMTRVFAIGSLSGDLLAAHRTAVAIQDAIAAAARPGVTGDELYGLALDMAVKAGLGGHFMGYGDQVKFVGHGIGLELNEWPVLGRGMKEPLQAGMTLAVEPKFIFPGRGAVGVENTFAVTPDGLERLTSYPDDVVIVGG
ncbi:M24 family metallopeptidase [Desulfotomaculum copahuensis]|uniref:Peptidase M24 n=1 Tax=Desulfotomaculum copahuensis TaxID=1838280 RepID=A0A1B7LKN8_9FIRM|nr:Xaa-Pro peptidase family protein [Desulfotomaculum copahuensis]OAT87032.1 peptidase M24 [Desulfotomaculum copahuensis]